MPLILRSAGSAAGLAPPLWLHFFLRFPHPFALRTNRRFLAALYGCSLGGGRPGRGAHCCCGPWDRPGRSRGFLRFMDARAGAARVSPPSSPLVALAGLALFWAGTRRQRSRKRKALLPALLLTTAILADLLVYRVLPAARPAARACVFARGSWVFFAPLPLLPLSFAYAIFRHGFFDVRRAILRWVSYFVVLGLILAVYLGGAGLPVRRGHPGDPARLGGRPGGPLRPAHRLAAALPAAGPAPEASAGT